MPYDFITPQEMEATLKERLEPILRKLDFLETHSRRWVPPKEAARITGVSEKTLRAEKEREGTLIVFKRDGAKAGCLLYDLLSLHAYNESKAVRRIRPAA